MVFPTRHTTLDGPTSRIRWLIRAASSITLIGALAACATDPPPSPVPPPLVVSTASPFRMPPTPAPSDPLVGVRPPMPERFPLPEGAEPALVDPDDPTIIGHWYVPLHGSEVYNFYGDELPRAGYPIEGLYPGGGVALIRFDEGSQILQVMMLGDLIQTDLYLQTDVP